MFTVSIRKHIARGAVNIWGDHFMVNLVEGFGFKLSRTDGSHHIFARPDIPKLVNLQNVKGQTKPYQMRQFLKLVEKHDLKLEDE